MSFFPVLQRALAHWWRDWFELVLLGMAWLLCWLTLLLGPPATFVACRIAVERAHGRTVERRELPAMLRRALGQSWLWFLLQLVALLAVAVNLRFYGSLQSPLGPLLQGAISAAAAIWFLLQLYALPFLMEQERKSLRLALRNALLTTLASPLYSVLVGVTVLAVVALCIRFPFLLLLGAPMLIALICANAVAERLERFRERGSAERNTGSGSEA